MNWNMAKTVNVISLIVFWWIWLFGLYTSVINAGWYLAAQHAYETFATGEASSDMPAPRKR